MALALFTLAALPTGLGLRYLVHAVAWRGSWLTANGLSGG